MTLPPAAARALAHLERFGVHLGLDHVRRLLAALGDPQRGLPVVLVAGTNGKGSTASLLAAIAGAAGYRTGLYTSPHLETVEERLRLDGRPVAGEALGEAVLEVLAAGGDTPPTYFEALTAAALLLLRRAEVDLAVLEVGLGGRLDATNVAEPRLSVVSPISLEHREILGDTVAAIAREKAGILRPDRPAVVWADDPEVDRALADAAAGLGTPLHRADRETRLEAVAPLADPWSGQRLALVTPQARYQLDIPLLGRHQAANAALSVRAAELLAGEGFARIDRAAIQAGAAAWRWPGRLEVLRPPPGSAPGLRRILLDAAHNPQGARSLAAFLAAPPGPLAAPPSLLFGVLADKDAAAMLAALAPLARALLLTRPPSPRARDPRDLLPLLPPGTAPPEPHPDLRQALDRLLTEPTPDTAVVAGSIYLIGAVRGELRARGVVGDGGGY